MVEKWQDQNKAHQFEMERGLRNLQTLVQTLDPSYRSIDEFLLDNPGAMKAIVEWIGSLNINTWRENLEAEVGLVEDEDGEEDEDEDLSEEEEIELVESLTDVEPID